MLDDTAGTNMLITLDGASPTLSALTLGSTAGQSYTVAQGSGGTLILSNGTSSAAVIVTTGTHSITPPSP